MKIKSLLILVFLALFFLPSFAFATQSPLGVKCSEDKNCTSGDCEDSDYEIDDDDYCVCKTDQDCGVTFGKEEGEVWTCEDGIKMSHDLHYCKSNKKGLMDPLKPKEIVGAITEQEASKTDKPVKLEGPKLSIPIPNLPKFADMEVTPGQVANVPYIAQYIVGVYRYAIIIGAILAVMMIMIGGIIYMTAGGIPANVEKGRTIIFGALTGLLLIICSHLVLKIINPNLVKLNALNIQTIKEVEFDDSPIETGAGAPASMPVGAPPTTPVVGLPGTTGGGTSIKGLIGDLPSTYPPCTTQSANYAADKLDAKNICVGPCHCAYTAANFLEYIGCTNIYNGNANWLAASLDASGWESTVITSSNRNNLPMGLLLYTGGGHVGVSLGGGKQFQSSGGKLLAKVNAGSGAKCPKTNEEAKANPSLCAPCSILTTEAPTTGKYASSSCTSNQAWVKENTVWSSWAVVVHPVVAGKTAAAKTACKFTAGGVTKTLNISQALCAILTNSKPPSSSEGTH